eukprot:2317587-Amphidinium_carterae.1
MEQPSSSLELNPQARSKEVPSPVSESPSAFIFNWASVLVWASAWQEFPQARYRPSRGFHCHDSHEGAYCTA